MADGFREWTVDGAGRRVRRGLTAAETAEVERLRDLLIRDHNDARRLRELWQRHELGRRQAIGAEAEARRQTKH